MLPKGFKRVSRRRKWDLYGGCGHLSFSGSKCRECGYDLWTPLRRRIRDLESGKDLSMDEQVRGVLEVITTPFQEDGFVYVGEEGRIPTLRYRRLASRTEDERIKRVLDKQQEYREMMDLALRHIEARFPQLFSIGLDEDDVHYLKEEVNAFLYALIKRFNFPLDEEKLWPMIAAYACRLADLTNSEAESVVDQLLIDDEEEFRWWLHRLRVTDETLGAHLMKRIER